MDVRLVADCFDVLQFQKVLVINLPERSDRRDAMTLATAVSGIDVEWIDGVAGKDVPDRVMPVDSLDKSISKGNKGSWRAHMDALQLWVALFVMLRDHIL